jgi:3-oxoisoapionate decarboxylase
MQLGISSFTYGWNIGIKDFMPEKPMNEVDLVNLTLYFGLKCLQIGDNLPIHTFSSSRKEQLKKLVKDNNIRIEIGAKKLNAENLQTYINLCQYFEAPILRFIIDGENYEPDKEEVISIINDFLPDLIKHNITLGIENHDRFKVKELAYIMEKINHKNIGICLDCVNSIGAGEGLEYVVETLAAYTVNLHFKDFKINRLPHKMGFIIDGEIAGQGMTNLPWLFEKIKPFGRCKSAILEQWVPPENDLDSTCKKEKVWAEAGIKYLNYEIKK